MFANINLINSFSTFQRKNRYSGDNRRESIGVQNVKKKKEMRGNYNNSFPIPLYHPVHSLLC